MPITICCFDKTGSFIRNGIAIALTNHAENIYLVTDEELVDVGILDIDQVPEKEWRQLVSRKSYPVITLSSEKKPFARNHLTKPVKFSELVELIYELSDIEGNITNIISTANAADNIESSSKRKKILKTRHSNSYNPDDYLTGFLSNILKRQNSRPDYTLFSWGKDKWSIVDSVNMRFISNVNRWTLQHLTVTPMKKLEYRKISVDEATNYSKTANSNDPIEDVLGFLAPYLSGKSMPDKVHINKKYRLTTWPNLTQYALSNNDLVIATYWTEYSTSIAELSSFFKLHIQELAPFVNYCYLCNFLTLSEQQTADVIPIRQPEKITKRSQGIGNVLRQIIDKLTVA